VKLSNSFTVGLPIDTAWALLTDLERVAPSLPGAELTQVEGDEYHGLMRVKVGPIVAQYSGRARFVTVDEPSHRAVLRAEGRDTNGQGNAAATMSIALRPDGERTAVEVETDLSISGRVAQFGRGVLGDVSTALLKQFVERLERDVAAGARGDAPGAGSPAARSTGSPASASSTPPEAVDLLQLVARSSARRFAVAGAAVMVSVVAVVVLRRALRRHP
jgi:carbon monoxide dehydrogenase subunit G